MKLPPSRASRHRRPAAAGQGLALCMLGLAVGAAHGQPAPPAGRSTAGSQQALEAVTVSATRREELVRDVPLSISSVPVEALEEVGAKSVNDYLSAVPGVVLQNNSVVDGAGNIVIRGLTIGLDSNPPTTAYLDDIPLARGTSYDLNLLDLRTFEVLRGPQGTLYGSSASGGILRYNSRQPDPTGFSARATAELSGTRGGLNGRLGGVVNVPIRENVAAFRVAAFGTREAGWVDATGSAGEDRVDKWDSHGARASVAVMPVKDLTVTLTGMTQTRNTDGGRRLVYDLSTGQQTGPDLVYPGLEVPEPTKSKRDLYGLTVDYDLGFARLTSTTGRQKTRSDARTDFSPLGLAAFGSPAYIDNGIEQTRTTQEVRLVSQGAATLQWLVGAFYDKQKIVTLENAYLGLPSAGPAPLSTTSVRRDYRETALYGDVTWNVNAALALTAGTRLAQYKQTDDARTSLSPANLLSFDENVSTYLLAARYRLTATSSVYARAADGYRPGGANFSSLDPATGQPIPGAQLSYKTDKVWTYEAGYKADLSQAVSFEVAYFYSDWRDLQQFTQPAGLQGVGFTSNLGKARITGIEAAGRFRLAQQFVVTGSVSLMDPKLKTDSPSLQAAAGDRLPNSPRTAFSVNGRYTDTVAGRPAFAAVNVSHVGNRNSGFPNATVSPNFRMPSYTQVDLTAGISFGPYDVSLYVRNLTDKRGILGASTGEAAFTGRTYAHVIDPRTIGVIFNANF